MNSEATLSNLLTATFDQIGEHARLVAIFLAVMVPVGTVALALDSGGNSELFGFDTGLMITPAIFEQGIVTATIGLAVFVAGVIMHYWLYAGMVRRSTALSFSRFLPFVGIYILATIGMVFGFILLVIPGFILLVRWIAVLPLVLAGDDPAMDSFGNSWEMTRGRGWSIFGAMVVLLVLLIIAAGIIGGATYLLGGDGSIGAMAVESLADHASAVLFAAFAVGAFRLMHDSSEELTEMFE
ncbi:glycerophosphoryl diester phosphodiesterase membrane domain-containing protein [Erythrobacter sp. JK5]|uniref:glycerophosphoryl diester phosphodiesterase membrane domain-containing protein n=1 Tax=Erythrobacter sp. JK5 TaxID=2829500 RepID=UPI001BAD5BB3|nr:glycerophosphoryl diester phosphodiesterase membrane domain-containing protein [Erythrobacter sp. JK5]QUL38948.1 glycerophosphoryl diester phosphodiesterase membrane domain-containing protein [Erythrobacter sp. JK5]